MFSRIGIRRLHTSCRLLSKNKSKGPMVPEVHIIPTPKQSSVVLMSGALISMVAGIYFTDLVYGVDLVCL